MFLFLIINFFTTLVSLAILFAGLLLGYHWYRGNLVGDAYPLISVLLLMFSFLGKHFVLFLLRLFRQNGNGIYEQHLGLSQNLTTERNKGNLYMETNEVESGATLILLHGWGVDNNFWHYVKRDYKDSLKIIAIDLIGSGSSSPARDKNYSLQRMAEDLDELINEIEGNIILVGHSIGGMVILEYCQSFLESYAKKIQKIVLVHTTYTDPTKTSIASSFFSKAKTPLLVPICYTNIIFSPIVRVTNWINYLNGLAHLGTMFIGFGGQETINQIDYAAQYITKVNPAINARGTLEMFKYDAEKALKNINIPTLVVAADKDKLTRNYASKYIADNIPQAEYVELKNAGHAGFFEKHEEFRIILSKFIFF